MGYIPLDYEELQKNTDGLLQSFNNLAERYQPASYDLVRAKVASLEETYIQKVKKKTNWINLSNTDLRCDQAACISQLLPKLPEKGDQTVINNAQIILFGAIFYRFKRLQLSYSGGYAFFGCTPKNSALYKILDNEFHLKTLDDETLATCCEAYQRYLKQADASSGANKIVGDQFPYIQEDKIFYEKLDDIITEAKKRAKPIHAQLQIIAFVNSVAAALRDTDQAVSLLLPRISELINSKLAQQLHLTSKQIIELIKNSKLNPSEAALAVLNLCLPARVSKETIQSKSGETIPLAELSFEDYIRQALVINSKYSLLGAYIMALGLCSEGKSKLRDALKSAINATGRNQLDEETKDYALTALSNYVRIPIPPRIPLDCKCWNADTGEASMIVDLVNRLNKLSINQCESALTV